MQRNLKCFESRRKDRSEKTAKKEKERKKKANFKKATGTSSFHAGKKKLKNTAALISLPFTQKPKHFAFCRGNYKHQERSDPLHDLT